MSGITEDRECDDERAEKSGRAKSTCKCHPNQIYILILCFLINVQSASCVSSIGIFLVEFMEYFQASKTAVTWIAGTNLGVSFIVGPLLGVFLKRFGSRTVGVASAFVTAGGLVLASFINNITSLYFTFGLMAGVGPPAYYAIANSTIQLYFKKHRALACAFALTAFSIGGFLWPPVTRWLIDSLCWQGTLLIFAGLHLQMIVVFFCVGLVNNEKVRQISKSKLSEDNPEGPSSEKPHRNPAKEYSGEKSSLSRFKCPERWLILSCMYSLGVCFGMILHMSVLVYTPTRGKELGIDKTKSAILVSIVNFAGGFCRIPAGLLGDLRYVNRGFFLATAIAIGGTLSIFSRFLQTFIQLAVFSAIYGCVIAIYLALQTVVLSDISGLEHLPVAMGVLLAGHGASNLLLHPTAGALLDSTGTANTIFIVTGFVGIAGSSLVVIAVIISVRSKKRLAKLQCDTDPRTTEATSLKDG